MKNWHHTYEKNKITIHESPQKNGNVIRLPLGQVGNIEDLVISLTAEQEASQLQDVQAPLNK